MPTEMRNKARHLELADEDLKSLRAFGKERRVARGETLWQAGDEPDTLYIVRSGKANMVIDSDDGKEAIVHYCAQAQTFCLAAALTGKPYPCTAKASAEMTVLAIPRKRFQDLVHRLPFFARQMMGDMAAQVCESHCAAALSAEPVKDRLADLLTRLNRQYQGGGLPFTRQELASMTGTTVESAIRTLSEWEKAGVIRSERGVIQVRQPEVLEEAAA